jgi:hypothetical protein
MRTREILILGIFIIAVCVISLIPFSNILSEGVNESFAGNTSATTVAGNTNVTTASVTTAAVTTVPKDTVAPQKNKDKINNNDDFLNSLIYYLSRPPDRDNDRVAIYNLQALILYIKTQNVSTLLGEISNPSNLNDPRLFLQYMNWFASHCPIDTSTCSGLC